MIKLLIFDLSNVCFNIEEPLYLEHFSKKHNVDYKELDDYYQKYLIKSEVGEITGKEVWKKVLKHFSIQEDVNSIILGMMKLKKALSTLDLIKKLKKRYR